MRTMYFLPALFYLITATEAFLGLEKYFGKQEVNSTESCQSPKMETDYVYCGEVPKTCEETKYRSYDGSCNNLEHSWWGVPLTPYVRLLPCNSYADCISKLPDNLPNARSVSLRIYVDIPKPDKVWNVDFMQYGQIIAHDMGKAYGAPSTKIVPLECCSEGQITLAGKLNPNCASIILPKNDPYNAPEGNKCMNFLRTQTTKNYGKCSNETEIAEQLTGVTGALDVSYIYGSDEKTAKSLRAFKGGKLASVMRNGREVLTQDPTPTLTCNANSTDEPCYRTGDDRVNQNPQLALLHNIYLAQHNSIAESLAKVNPHWDDEKLYQETRRVVIAQHQHVTYYEFLPPLIGKQNMIDKKLIYPNAKCHIKDYDRNVNLAASNEFSTSALRMFHSEIVGDIKSYKENRNVTNQINLYEWMDRPSVCEHGNNFEGLTIGMATQAQSAPDRYVTNHVTNLLFKKGLLGQDLKSIDIQRGRDHGLCPYAQTLKELGLSNPKSFDDFEKFIKKEYVDILKDLYASYKDVDLTVGLSIETNLPDALCGVTVQALLTEQFKRTRVGDRFFYENGHGKYAFTCDQLNEIRRSSSMAGFLCYNKGVKKMQPKAFEHLSETNQLKLCSEIPRFNPEAWKEKK